MTYNKFNPSQSLYLFLITWDFQKVCDLVYINNFNFTVILFIKVVLGYVPGDITNIPCL